MEPIQNLAAADFVAFGQTAGASTASTPICSLPSQQPGGASPSVIQYTWSKEIFSTLISPF